MSAPPNQAEPAPDVSPNPEKDRSGFWISLWVFLAMLGFIGVGFLGAYFLMQPASS